MVVIRYIQCHVGPNYFANLLVPPTFDNLLTAQWLWVKQLKGGNRGNESRTCMVTESINLSGNTSFLSAVSRN